MKITQARSENPLFSEKRLIARQKRALRIGADDVDFLVKRVAEDFAYRITATNRTFYRAADFFSFSGTLSSTLEKLQNVSSIIRYELPQISEILVKTSGYVVQSLPGSPESSDFARQNWPENLDLVVSAFGLHSSNKLPGLMLEILRSMKKDGLVLIALPIHGTLRELRDCLTRAELELTGGATSRIDPFIDMQQAGKLLQTTGFRLPVVDREDIVIRYDDMFALINDLRSMGITSALTSGNHRKTHRYLFARADRLYRENYCDTDGRIRASFCFAYLTAWSPHENQQKPLRPGSARYSLSRYLKHQGA